jgi:hypothetical protein
MCRRYKGLTLLELLLAISITVFVIGSLAAVSRGVQENYEYGDAYGTVSQHGRVVMDRITRMAGEAWANENFPGMLVLTTDDGSWKMPETLVIWHPARTTSNPQGMPTSPQGYPYFNELKIWCPDLTDPSNLLEITPSEATPATSSTNWATKIPSFRPNNPDSTIPVLTKLVHKTPLTGSTRNTKYGAIRFVTRFVPQTITTSSWKQLPWSQGMYSSQTGLRGVWLRMEMQLDPQSAIAPTSSAARPAVPFFGSATLNYTVQKDKTIYSGP